MPTGSTENGLRFPPHDPCEPVEKIIKGPVTEQEKEEIKKMYADGIGVCEIARKTGYAQSSISRWVGTWKPNSKEDKPMKVKEKEPAVAPTTTSSNKNILQLNDTAKLKICQEALERIAVSSHDYISGFARGILAAINYEAGDDDA
ncbi:MAG: helix-turn-helix domain-containing protein [Oscillospiraceae bacterium]